MASTTAAYTTLASPPSLASMAVGDIKTVSGKCVTSARIRELITTATKANAKAFSVSGDSMKNFIITRKK